MISDKITLSNYREHVVIFMLIVTGFSSELLIIKLVNSKRLCSQLHDPSLSYNGGSSGQIRYLVEQGPGLYQHLVTLTLFYCICFGTYQIIL